MEVYKRFLIVCFVCFEFHCTEQAMNHLAPVLQNRSPCDECIVGVLRQSHAQHVRLVCGSNATYCPTNVLSQTGWMSWMFFDVRTNVTSLDRREFCVIAGDNLTHTASVFNADKMCPRQKLILVFPSDVESKLPRLKILFLRAWMVGITDLVVVLSGPLCRVFSHVPSKEKGKFCDGSDFTLINSWTAGLSCGLNNTGVAYFPEHKITSLHLCSIDVVYVYNDPKALPVRKLHLKFLEVAMNATFNFIFIGNKGRRRVSKRVVYPPEIRVGQLSANETILKYYVVASHIEEDVVVYAVPRVLSSSVEWFRITKELSVCVWIALAISLLFSATTLYLFAKGSRDLIYICLLSVQPLVGLSWSADFLSWRGRVFYTVWNLLCVVLTSSYLCTLLSELMVPSSHNAINNFDDLVKSGLPVYAIVHKTVQHKYTSLPYFQPLMNRTEFGLDRPRRRNIAYLIEKSRHEPYEFMNMDYIYLPEVVRTSYTMPYKMTRDSPYGRLFEIAFMRAVGAGSLERLNRLRNHIKALRRRRNRSPREDGDKPIALKSFRPVFVLWLSGSGIALSVFICEFFSKRIPT